MTIAQEIAAYDDTNYPGIPPANPGGGPTPDQLAATTSSANVLASASSVNIPVDSSAGFLVGSIAVIDTYDSHVQESQIITAISDVDSSYQYITVKHLTYAHNGTTTPFPVTQPGEKGVLIAEWYEYTPTSGTDIAVNSDLTTIA
jgi:hypothetical protein